MSTTVQEVFNISMDLMSKRLESGILSEDEIKRYSVKTPSIITLLQSELIQNGDLYSTFEISNKPLKNMLGDGSNFNITEYEDEELIYEASGSVKAYYFEVDAPCTVYIEDYDGSWNTLETITDTTATSFTAYKGVVTPTSGATKSRLRFTGSYYFRTINRAMFDVSLQDSTRVPEYRPWFKKSMPSDFKSVDEIIKETPTRQYNNFTNFKWEGRRDLYINYFFEGNIRIIYHPIPIAISALTDTLQVDDVTARTILPYGLSAHLLLVENPDSASFFQQRFEELKFNTTRKKMTSIEKITDVYSNLSGW